VHDYNAATHEGFGRSQYSIHKGRISSAAAAYLRPALKRRNLKLETKALTTRVLMTGTKATGIEYVRNGELRRALAEKEVILSAGTFNTPQVLMLSGIGPAAHLKEIGITPLLDLPVGKNLQDHVAALIMYSRPSPGPFRAAMRFDRMATGMVCAHFFGKGVATVVPGGLHAFIKTRPELSVPDIEFMFRGAPTHAHLWFPLIRRGYVDGYGIRPTLLHPESRGQVKLASADPRAHPRIFMNLLSVSSDLAKLREGFKRARELAMQSPLDPFRGAEVSPGEKVKSDQEIDAWLKKTVITAHHPASTCPMGTTDDCVLDPEMRVLGTERLRVVDASAMPDLVSAHINATVLMMAEKAADIIRGRQTTH
jgi:choline dehydrogenase-like flavoprotein